MKKVLDYLEQLDFSKTEAKLYVILLSSGPMSVTDLAAAARINRTAAYVYIRSLLERGAIAEVMQESRKQVLANEPEQLQYLIQKKQDSVNALREKFPDILDTITTSFAMSKQGEKVGIKYYKGIVNARKIYEEALNANKLRTFVRIDKAESLFPSNATIFSKAFEKNKLLKIWEIIYDVESSAPPSKESRSYKDRYFYKYMPKRKKLSSEDILIYDNKVAIINFREGKTSIVLNSPDFYNNFKEIFDFLWDILPEVESIGS